MNETVTHIDIFYFRKKVHNHDSFSFTKLNSVSLCEQIFTVLLLKDNMCVKIQSHSRIALSFDYQSEKHVPVESFPNKTSTV